MTWWTRADVERYTKRTWAQLQRVPSWPSFPAKQGRRWDRAAVMAWWDAHQSRQDGRWDTQDVARTLGLSWETVRTYRRRGTLPEPDGVDANHPWWWPATILEWEAARQPRGSRNGLPHTSRGGRPRAGRVHQRRWR